MTASPPESNEAPAPEARRRRTLSLALSLALLVGVAAVVVLGGRDDGDEGRDRNIAGQVVRGLVGSEKEAFFADPAVVEAFAAHGLAVEVEPAGSRQIADADRLAGVDFAFPGSAPAAETVRQLVGAERAYTPFRSPMAIASFRTVADVLRDAGVARLDEDGTWAFDVARFLDLASEDVTWADLDPGGFDVRRNVLVRTTDPRNSNSAAMFLALTSHVANGAVVATEAQRAAVMPEVSSLFLEQGFAAASSAPPFEEYLATGMGNTPLLFVYEAQFLAEALDEDGTIVVGGDDPDREMVLLYPSPTIVSAHTVVPLSDAGDEVGRLLTEDVTLQRLAAEHGFRPSDPDTLRRLLADRIGDRLPLRPDVTDAVDAPSWEVLEAMLRDLEAQYASAGAPRPSPEAS